MKTRHFLTQLKALALQKPQRRRILLFVATPLLAIFALISPTITWAVAEIDIVWGTDPSVLAVVGAGTSVTTGSVNFTPNGSTLLNTPVSLYFKVVHKDEDVDGAQLFLGGIAVMPRGGSFTFADNVIPIFPSSLAPNTESGIFKITLDANRSGSFAGSVEFRYNDGTPTGTQSFMFNLSGIVATIPSILF
jgi:hypothetical protein